jgi:hypothetical protein
MTHNGTVLATLPNRFNITNANIFRITTSSDILIAPVSAPQTIAPGPALAPQPPAPQPVPILGPTLPSTPSHPQCPMQ